MKNQNNKKIMETVLGNRLSPLSNGVKIFKKMKPSKGSALLIAILMSTVVLTVGLGVYQRAYKELTFSSLWRQTDVAFGAADAGLECAIYRDLHPAATSCFGSTFAWTPTIPGTWSPSDINVAGGCVNIAVTKAAGGAGIAAGTVLGTYTTGNFPWGDVYDNINKAVWVSTAFGVAKLHASDGTAFSGSPFNTGGTAPWGLVFDPTRNLPNGIVWAANSSSGSVSEMDAGTGLLITRIPTGGTTPGYLVVDNTDGVVWVTNSATNNISELDANGPPSRVFVGSPFATGGTTPRGTAFDGGTIWIANGGSSNVSRIDTSGNQFGGPYPVGSTPRGLIYDATNGYVWVANSGSNSVSKLRTSDGSNAIGSPFSGGSMNTPWDLAIDPVNGNTWITNSGSTGATGVTVLNTMTGAFVANYNTGSSPHGITYDPDDKAMWITNYNGNSVTEISTGTSGGSGHTTIEARGSSDPCGSINPRRVERGLRIKY